MKTTCLFCGGDRREPNHLARCDGRQGRRRDPHERPDSEELSADPRDIPGTVSFWRELAQEKGYDE